MTDQPGRTPDDLQDRLRYHSASLDRPLMTEAAGRIAALERDLAAAQEALRQEREAHAETKHELANRVHGMGRLNEAYDVLWAEKKRAEAALAMHDVIEQQTNERAAQAEARARELEELLREAMEESVPRVTSKYAVVHMSFVLRGKIRAALAPAGKCKHGWIPERCGLCDDEKEENSNA